MKHEPNRAGYAQTHRASLSNAHLRERCVRPTVRAGVTDIDGPQHSRAAGMDAASVHACRACTRVVCMPEGCVSARRAATQPRSAVASHCAAAQRAKTTNRLGIPPISHTPRLRVTRRGGQGAIRIPLQAALLASLTTCWHPRPRSLLETSCLSLEMAGQETSCLSLEMPRPETTAVLGR